MLKKWLSFLIIFTSIQVFSEEPIVSFCKEKKGEVFGGLIPCANNGRVENGLFCIFSREPLVYANGCNLEQVGFGYHKTFLKACVAHDLCYHNEPQTTGLSRKACDQNFYSYMLSICKTRKKVNLSACESAAWSYYNAVRAGGSRAYKCANHNFDYTEILGFKSGVQTPAN